ncbi:MAG TPA: EAL domain-containing protein [Cycloclasticus sp.]|nr:EAL domain-containing protein [Cycloclasticus sp.]
MSDSQVTNEFLTKPQALGCKIARDNFNAGSSPYQYLKKLPSDILKIDGQGYHLHVPCNLQSLIDGLQPAKIKMKQGHLLTTPFKLREN